MQHYAEIRLNHTNLRELVKVDQNLTVLIIDDDKFSQKFISKCLNQHFSVVCASNGEEGIAKAKQLAPDIILLDVEMPGMNGFEVCDQLKLDPETQLRPIMFLSGHSSIREQMQGYELGADDYISKPFVAEQLIAKIKVAVKYSQQRDQLEHQIAAAKSTAMSALSNSGELGLVLRFIDSTTTTQTLDELAQNIFNVTNLLKLHCCLLITGNEGESCYSSDSVISPLESKLMSQLRQRNRFFDFGCRTQINYDNISLLVKNMPINDQEKYGRYKDMLPSLVGSADIKASKINTVNSIKHQNSQLQKTIHSLEHSLRNVNHTSSTNYQNAAKKLREMSDELIFKLPSMGLEEDQELFILSRIDTGVDEALQIIDAGNELGNSFNAFLVQLNQHIQQQSNIVDSMFDAQNESLESDDDADSSYQMDVELF